MIADKELRLALKFALAFAGVGVALWVLYNILPIITIFVIAVFIVYCVNPLVKLLIQKNIQPLLAAIIASLIILIILLLFFYLLIPGLTSELLHLTNYLTFEMLYEFPNLLSRLNELDLRFNLQLSETFIQYIEELTRQIPGHIQGLLRTLTSISMKIISQAWIALALVFLVFYLVQDMEKAKKNLTLLFPMIYHEEVARILAIIDQKVGAYIRGTLVKSLLVVMLTWLGLTILGVPFALMLGLLAGLLNIILYIGPVMAAVPALLLSLAPGTPSFFFVLTLYILVQALDAFVFTPILLGKAVDISPLTVIVVILIGGQLMGILGIILAIPLTAIFKVLLFHYYLEKSKKA